MLPPIGLIDPKNPPENSTLLYTSTDEWDTHMTRRFYVIPGFWIFNMSELETEPLDQLELPLEALPWLVSTIENKFWKKPLEGGLPRGVTHVMAEIRGEKIRLGRSNNAGAEDVPGFTLKNLSRLDSFSAGETELDGTNTQSAVIPDFIMQEGGLFTLLKSIAERYLQGEFGPVR